MTVHDLSGDGTAVTELRAVSASPAKVELRLKIDGKRQKLTWLPSSKPNKLKVR